MGSPAAGVANLEKRIEKASQMLQKRTAETMELLQRYLETPGREEGAKQAGERD